MFLLILISPFLYVVGAQVTEIFGLTYSIFVWILGGGVALMKWARERQASILQKNTPRKSIRGRNERGPTCHKPPRSWPLWKEMSMPPSHASMLLSPTSQPLHLSICLSICLFYSSSHYVYFGHLLIFLIQDQLRSYILFIIGLDSQLNHNFQVYSI